MITHNVLNDRPFSNQWQDRFFRQWISVRPDILHLQEIYSHSTQETEELIQSCLGGTWFSAGHNDCKTISRYPIAGSWSIDGNLAVLIDTTASIGTPMLCINAHFPCCANDEGRQEEADAVMAFIREAYQPGGAAHPWRRRARLDRGRFEFIGSWSGQPTGNLDRRHRRQRLVWSRFPARS